MAFNVAALVDYVNENETQLIARSLFDSKTPYIIKQEGNVMVGVTASQKINTLNTDAIFQDGSTCNPTVAGTTTISQRNIQVGRIGVFEDVCIGDLDKKYLSKSLVQDSEHLITLPFEAEYVALKAGAIAENVESAVWLGDTTSANVSLKWFDGFVKLIDAAGVSVIQSNVALYTGVPPITVATGITLANIKTIINSLWLAAPAKTAGKKDTRIFCGWDVFNKYVNAFTDQNLFNFMPKGTEVSAEEGTITIPGTIYRLTAVHGLDNTNRLFLMRTSNMFAAVDMLNATEQFKFMREQYGNSLRFQARFSMGVNVAFPDEVVSFKLV
jgi:hypothetical protein